MADFTSEFWGWFIAIPTILGLVYCLLLVLNNNKAKSNNETSGEDVETMGHVWDGDLEEYNNPLPKWWLWMFLITIVFGAVYLVLYPGLGKFQGILGWSSESRYDNEVIAAEKQYAPLYASFLEASVDELASNSDAMGTAKRLFANNCALCHGADAGGNIGFPNLTDDAWLYGGDEAAIKTTLMNGRNAVMPPWGPVLGEEGVDQVSEYVYSLSQTPNDPELVEPGKQRYDAMCAACHGADAKGNPALGAPNLADNAWLYGGSLEAIKESVEVGRNGVMPAFSEQLAESQIHLLTAYLKSLQKP